MPVAELPEEEVTGVGDREEEDLGVITLLVIWEDSWSLEFRFWRFVQGKKGRGVRGVEDGQGASFGACAPGGGRTGLTQDGGSQESFPK